MTLAAIFFAAATAAATTTCPAFVGQKPELATFEDVRSSLPQIPPKNDFESTDTYVRRLAAAEPQGSRSFVLRRTPKYEGEGLSYDPDRRVLTVYRAAFGAGRTNFNNIGGQGMIRGKDNFASAIGFEIATIETGRDTYVATNGFGAEVTVVRVTQQVNALWERPGKQGEDPFEHMDSGIVARIPMEPAVARDLIEHGAAALTFTPKAPYHAATTALVPPSFNSPRERRDVITVLTGDVHCGFLIDSQGVVAHAFTVK
ncbi:MAG: hypothetical protein WA842_09715 [Croceibacterium sp.]